jgi:hypothetical protein
MSFLSKEQIFEADDRVFDVVDCPEWGGKVRISSISVGQRDAYEESLIVGRGKNRDTNLRNARAKLIVMCAVDESGHRLFTPDDVTRLSRKNAKPADRLFDACRRLVGLSEEDVERLTEDFEETRDDDSSID